MPKKSKKPANHTRNTTIHKTACKHNTVCVTVYTRYGMRSGCCTIKEAASLCQRSEATVRRWLRNQSIADQASAQLLAIYVSGVMPWEAFDGFRLNDDGKLVDTCGYTHTAAEIQQRGQYLGENKRLKMMIDKLKGELEQQHQNNQRDIEEPAPVRPLLRLVK